MPPKARETRFPTGRIKKIMQQDEEVGKIAKAAPVLVSKALELLIGELVGKAAAVTRSQKAVTINVKHLREAVAKEKTFDFLQDVVGRFVPSNENDDKVIGSDVEDDAAAAGEDSASDSDDEGEGKSADILDVPASAAGGALAGKEDAGGGEAKKEDKKVEKEEEAAAKPEAVVYAHRQIDEDYDDDDDDE